MSPPVVATVGGKKVVVHAGKTGWVYVLDAATGKLVRRSDAFRAAGEHVRAADRQGHADAAGRQRRRGVVADLDRSDAGLRLRRRAAPADELHRHTAPWEKGRLWLGSAFVAIPGEEQYGLFSAVDLKTGKIAWQKKVPQPMMGGSLATAGGLTFTGEGNGNFNAYDSKTGKLLWQFNAGAGCNSAPMSFKHGGEQFIAVACGGNFQLNYPLGDAVMVFGLPGKRQKN